MIRLEWTDADGHPEWLGLVMVGAIGAVALAVFELPPLALHGPLHDLGVMDPLCGMTRAVRLLARGDLSSAWRYNPGSFVIAAASLLVVVRALVGSATGRWMRVTSNRGTVAVVYVLAGAMLEINQQAHARLLR